MSEIFKIKTVTFRLEFNKKTLEKYRSGIHRRLQFNTRNVILHFAEKSN